MDPTGRLACRMMTRYENGIWGLLQHVSAPPQQWAPSPGSMAMLACQDLIQSESAAAFAPTLLLANMESCSHKRTADTPPLVRPERTLCANDYLGTMIPSVRIRSSSGSPSTC